MKRRAKWLLFGVPSVTLVVLALVGAWLLGTEAGLRQVLRLAGGAPGVTVSASGPRGSLLGGFSIDALIIEHERARIAVTGIRSRLDLTAMPIARLRLAELAVTDLSVTVKPRLHPWDQKPVHFLPGPLSIAVDRLAVATLEVHAPGSEAAFTRLGGTLLVAQSSIDATDLGISSEAFDAGGRATLRAGEPLGLESALVVTLRAAPRPLPLAVSTSGSLDALKVSVQTTAPAGASLVGTLALHDVLRLDGRLEFHNWDPAVLGTQRTTGPINGTIAVSGWLDGLHLDGRVTASRASVGPIALSALARYAHHTLVIEHARGSVETATRGAPATVMLSGRVVFGREARIDLDGAWNALRWPLGTAMPAITSSSGTLHLAGNGHYDYRLSAAVGGSRVPPATVTARGALDATELLVAAFDATVADGRITGAARLGLGDARAWSLTARGDGLNPGVWRAPLAGQVGVALRAEGEGFEPLGHWSVHIDRLDGTVRHQPARGGGTITARAGRLEFDAVALTFGSAQLRASGTVGVAKSLDWHLQVGQLGDFFAGASGSLRSEGAISGELAHLMARGMLAGVKVGYGAWHAAQVTAEVAVDASDRTPSAIKVLVRDLGIGARQLGELRLGLDGVATAHAMSIRWKDGSDTGELATHGSLRDDTWTLGLDSLAVTGPPLYAYHLEAPATATLAMDATSLTHACFVRDSARVCAEGSWSANHPWAVALEGSGLPLRIPGLRLPRDTDYGGTLAVQGHARAAPGVPWTGELAVQLADGTLSFTGTNGRPVSVPVGNGRLEVHAIQGAYTASLGFASPAGSYVAGSAQLGRSEAPLGESKLMGDASLATTELGLLPLFLPGVDRVAGRIEMNIHLAGTGAAPLLAGSARFADGEVDSYRTNLLLRAVQATLAIDGDTLTLAATANTRGGSASAGGEITWRNRKPAGHLQFKGEHLLLADLPEAKIIASPDLKLNIDGGLIKVRGDITIPTARIAPRDLRRAVLASGDERIVDEEATPPDQRLKTDTAVRLVLGEDVTIDGYGLEGKLGGELLLIARNDEVPFGTGELTIREGNYTAYTRKLDIDRGRLLFAGQSLGNPGLDIRAQRKVQTITAGINVRGTLLVPQISFYSDPAMSQSQIASVLIVGKTLDDIQDSDKTSIGGSDTRNALIAQGSALLAGELGRYVGLSDVGVESGINNTTSVVVGKFLSPRLYVSYGVSLTEAINTLKLRYTIGDRWVIRTESGARQSADIEFTIER